MADFVVTTIFKTQCLTTYGVVIIHCVWSSQKFWYRSEKTIDAEAWVDSGLDESIFKTTLVIFYGLHKIWGCLNIKMSSYQYSNLFPYQR